MRNLGSRAVLFLLVLCGAGLALASCSSGADDAAEPARSSSTTAAPTTTSSTLAPPDFATVEEAVASTRPIVLAHAGGENASPHSTPYAYARAVAAGVDVLDLDVRLTADGMLVVHHDETVDRTTNGTGRVDELTWAELEALDAAYWFTETCSACTDRPDGDYLLRGVRTGEVPPPEGTVPEDFAPVRVEDLISRYPDHVLNIEIKGAYPESVPVAQELARVLTEQDRLDAAVVTAFDDQLAEAFHELAPAVEITSGLDAMTRYVLAGERPAEGRRIMQVPPEYSGVVVLTPDLVARAHADGMVLWIWPNEREWENAEGYRTLLDLGVDGINAADPGVAVEAVRATG